MGKNNKFLNGYSQILYLSLLKVVTKCPWTSTNVWAQILESTASKPGMKLFY